MVALDGTTNGNKVYEWNGFAWQQVFVGLSGNPVLAIDISVGKDGTLCWVSNEPAFALSSDYKIYTLSPDGLVKQEVGAGVHVDCWDKFNLIYSDSHGLGHILHANDPDSDEFC